MGMVGIVALGFAVLFIVGTILYGVAIFFSYVFGGSIVPSDIPAVELLWTLFVGIAGVIVTIIAIIECVLLLYCINRAITGLYECSRAIFSDNYGVI